MSRNADVHAPMARPSERIAAAEVTRFFFSWRQPKTKSDQNESMFYILRHTAKVTTKFAYENFGRGTTSFAGTGSSGSRAFFQALNPPSITADGMPRSASILATRTAVASRMQVQ